MSRPMETANEDKRCTRCRAGDHCRRARSSREHPVRRCSAILRLVKFGYHRTTAVASRGGNALPDGSVL